ncbi:hypothetical protein AGR5A_Lc30026 [Agrobacterium genomosp. 5 str. CFBP 6626]|nr:hypothetical protein AGR5A_Lc30026 [Agrobacterium genomosp. 5 str. CFBP 6626]
MDQCVPCDQKGNACEENVSM